MSTVFNNFINEYLHNVYISSPSILHVWTSPALKFMTPFLELLLLLINVYMFNIFLELTTWDWENQNLEKH